MAISDAQFRWSVIAAGVGLALGIASVRFCGSVALPPKVTARAPVTGTAKQLMTKTSESTSVYVDLVAKDAAAAGVVVPSLDEMRRPLVATIDEGRHVLELGKPAVTINGLQIAAVRTGETLGLEIFNATDKDLGYLVVTKPTPWVSACNSARPLPLNVMVIAKGQRELRVECVYRAGTVIAVTRVETVELSPLQAWYLSQTPPALVGIEERIAKGHRGPQVAEKCSPLMGEALQSRIENGEIRWRDLVDFYARHRCQTFQFPSSYKAFTQGDTRELPVSR